MSRKVQDTPTQRSACPSLSRSGAEKPRWVCFTNEEGEVKGLRHFSAVTKLGMESQDPVWGKAGVHGRPGLGHTNMAPTLRRPTSS